jgi:hypothetical protein
VKEEKEEVSSERICRDRGGELEREAMGGGGERRKRKGMIKCLGRGWAYSQPRGKKSLAVHVNYIYI